MRAHSAISRRLASQCLALPLLCSVLSGACAPSSPGDHTYTLQGQVLAIDADRQRATIKHDDIKGLMPAMTMPYKMQDPKLLDGIAPGDLVRATLVVVPDNAYLTRIEKVGTAPLEQLPGGSPGGPPLVPTGPGLLKPGEDVPSAHFVDQDGRTREFAAFKGSPTLVTFIYTRCPLPDFCPLMDRHFAAIQAAIKGDPALARVRLVSVSFDPAVDTPHVLRQHAADLHADPAVWTFLTGTREDIDAFASRFGVAIVRAGYDQRDITHNLRTAIVDANGRLAKIYTGNTWTPAQVLADLKSTP